MNQPLCIGSRLDLVNVFGQIIFHRPGLEGFDGHVGGLPDGDGGTAHTLHLVLKSLPLQLLRYLVL